jgi:hypothetical protein
MSNPKPLVTIATACDNMLTESDGTISLIRVIDLMTLTNLRTDIGATPQEMPNVDFAVPVNAVVCLKSGDFKGEGELSLKAHLPDGTRKDFPEKWNFLMEGEEKGINVNIKFGLSTKHIGLTWIEVYWNGELLTKFPVRLRRQEASKIPNAPSQ